MPAPPKLFVLLQHVLPDGSRHWDLCLDQGDSLATWQLADDPSGLAAGTTACLRARRIADHRRAWLDYEGRVSGDRGHAMRVDRGTLSIVAHEADRWRVRLAGSILIGTYEIFATGDSGEWVVQPIASG